MAEFTVVKVNYQLCSELSKDLHDVVDRWTRRHEDIKDEVLIAARAAAVNHLAELYGYIPGKETNEATDTQPQ